MISSEKSNLQNWLLLGALTLIWGSSYILIKKSLVVFSPVEMGSLRISLSFLACIPFLYKAVQDIPKEKYPYIIFVGLFGTGFPAFLFAFAMVHISSSVSGIINSLSPLFTVLTGLLLFGVVVTRTKMIGVLIGFLGAIVLVLGKKNLNFKADLFYALLPVLATFCYGLNSNFVKRFFPTTNALYVTAIAMSVMGIPSLAVLFSTNFVFKMQHTEGAIFAFSCVFFLALFGTVIAWLLFYRLVQRTDALMAASVTYLIPVVALAWGLADGETLNMIQLAGMGLILAGVYFVGKREMERELC